MPRTGTSAVLFAHLRYTACGGGHSTARSDADPGCRSTPAPTEVWSISGRVTAYGSNVGVSGAHVTADGATPADTDADGRYRLGTIPSRHAGHQSDGRRHRVHGPGFLRSLPRWRADRTRHESDPPGAAFSLEFYRQLVRDAATDDFPDSTPALVWRLPAESKRLRADHRPGR